MDDDAPLLRRFPQLSRIPRATLGRYPTPLERVKLGDGRELLVKRDDLGGDAIGGNKIRGLEWLLGHVRPREKIVSVGAIGSTHALALALSARQLGARTTIVRWNQEMNRASRRVDARLREAARVVDARFVAAAYAIAALERVRGATWIPAGGSTPRAVLGHANAALEVLDQLERQGEALPQSVVVPLGTGSTAAGLALGFAIGGARIEVVAVRVVPAIVARRSRILRLAKRAADIIEKTAGMRIPSIGVDTLRVEHGYYGGGYGHPLSAKSDAAFGDAGIELDETYSAKAYAAAIALKQRTLLWLTFDGRLLKD